MTEAPPIIEEETPEPGAESEEDEDGDAGYSHCIHSR